MSGELLIGRATQAARMPRDVQAPCTPSQVCSKPGPAHCSRRPNMPFSGTPRPAQTAFLRVCVGCVFVLRCRHRCVCVREHMRASDHICTRASDRSLVQVHVCSLTCLAPAAASSRLLASAMRWCAGAALAASTSSKTALNHTDSRTGVSAAQCHTGHRDEASNARFEPGCAPRAPAHPVVLRTKWKEERVISSRKKKEVEGGSGGREPPRRS